MSVGHPRASRLDHDNVLSSKDPVGLALGSGRTWEGEMTRSQHARYPKKEITHTFGVIMSGAFVHLNDHLGRRNYCLHFTSKEMEA